MGRRDISHPRSRLLATGLAAILAASPAVSHASPSPRTDDPAPPAAAPRPPEDAGPAPSSPEPTAPDTGAGAPSPAPAPGPSPSTAQPPEPAPSEGAPLSTDPAPSPQPPSRPADAAPEAEPEPAEPTSEPAPPPEPAREADSPPADAATDATPDVPERLPPLQQAAWWTLFGAFALGTTAGVFAGLADREEDKAIRLASRFDTERNSLLRYEEVESDYEDALRRGEAFETTAIVLASVGGAAILAAIAVFAVDAVRPAPKRRARLVPLGMEVSF